MHSSGREVYVIDVATPEVDASAQEITTKVDEMLKDAIGKSRSLSHELSPAGLRVLLADDHDVVRQGLASLLGEEEGVEVVGEATNGREAGAGRYVLKTAPYKELLAAVRGKGPDS